MILKPMKRGMQWETVASKTVHSCLCFGTNRHFRHPVVCPRQPDLLRYLSTCGAASDVTTFTEAERVPPTCLTPLYLSRIEIVHVNLGA